MRSEPGATEFIVEPDVAKYDIVESELLGIVAPTMFLYNDLII